MEPFAKPLSLAGFLKKIHAYNFNFATSVSFASKIRCFRADGASLNRIEAGFGVVLNEEFVRNAIKAG